MKVLIVASYTTGHFSPFVIEQIDSLSKLGIEFDFFGVSQKGIKGYLSCRKSLVQKIKQYNPDLIHAHYGLSGLLANLQRRIPVVTTFHGSDIHSGDLLLWLSRACMRLSAFNLFVSKRLYEIAQYKRGNYSILPCGTDINTFYAIPRNEAREMLDWGKDGKYVLFAGAFENRVKNAALAQEAVALIEECQLIELKGYDRKKVNVLMNACDCLLMTSEREASPMVIKEAMLCGCPIVSVDVGDVKELIAGINGCYLASRSSADIADKLSQAFGFHEKTDGRGRIIHRGMELLVVAQQIQMIYNKVVKVSR